jgi:two-component system, cell cycle response regulator CpdR
MQRILIVDDEAISVMVMSTYLADLGYDVQTASTGKEAIERGHEFSPDLLITDWRLADDVDGVEVSKRLKESNPSLQILLISGLPREEFDTHTKGIGIYRYFEKPCELEDIGSAVKEALESGAPEKIQANV